MKNKKVKNKLEKRIISISQSLILIMAIFAFAWMISAEFKTVSAACLGDGGQIHIEECNNEGDLIFLSSCCEM